MSREIRIIEGARKGCILKEDENGGVQKLCVEPPGSKSKDRERDKDKYKVGQIVINGEIFHIAYVNRPTDAEIIAQLS